MVASDWEGNGMCHIPEKNLFGSEIQRGPMIPCTVLRTGIQSMGTAKVIQEALQFEMNAAMVNFFSFFIKKKISDCKKAEDKYRA